MKKKYKEINVCEEFQELDEEAEREIVGGNSFMQIIARSVSSFFSNILSGSN